MMQAALIGLGMVADTHIKAIAATGGAVVLRGVHARRIDQARAVAAKITPRPRVYETLDDIVADDGLDFVILATPPDAREAFVAAFAAAGLPILIEKPIERDLPRARALVEVCEDAGVPMGVVLQHRTRPTARILQERIDTGALGKIEMVEVRVPWWRPQSYYDEPGRGTWARDGGGALITQAIHLLDLMLALTGNACGPVRTVQAMTGTTALHQMEAEDFASAGLTFANGALGSVTATTAAFPGGSDEIAVHGTRASARLSRASLTIAGHDGAREEIGGSGQSGGGTDPMAFSADRHRDVIAEFAAALGAGHAPVVTGRQALAGQALIDAIQLSSKTGRRVDLGGD